MEAVGLLLERNAKLYLARCRRENDLYTLHYIVKTRNFEQTVNVLLFASSDLTKMGLSEMGEWKHLIILRSARFDKGADPSGLLGGSDR